MSPPAVAEPWPLLWHTSGWGLPLEWLQDLAMATTRCWWMELAPRTTMAFSHSGCLVLVTRAGPQNSCRAQMWWLPGTGGQGCHLANFEA